MVICMKKTIIYIIILGCLIGVLFVDCPLYNIVGIPCPSCGMTRAFFSLLHGDFKMAFAFHPMWWTIPLVICVVIFRNTRFGRVLFRPWAAWVLLAIFIVTYAVRMFYLFPNIAPMQYNYDCILYQFI